MTASIELDGKTNPRTRTTKWRRTSGPATRSLFVQRWHAVKVGVARQPMIVQPKRPNQRKAMEQIRSNFVVGSLSPSIPGALSLHAPYGSITVDTALKCNLELVPEMNTGLDSLEIAREIANHVMS